ncbi:ADP-ribosylglycohydrolase [Tricholoma matsutake]|nr:ADP-ribosylglycohydrolase [Tricholoma matsutake 945]
MATPPLYAQCPTRTDPSTKIRLSMLATAMVDALGGPAEFHERFSFPLVTTMKPNKNFDLRPGVWTDDTSTTLCLARSLATYTAPFSTAKGGFDERDQLDAYVNWESNGILSATGSCFDIGNTISHALHIYKDNPPTQNSAEQALQRICETLSSENCAGNGSLMRVLPVGLAYWRDGEVAKEYARRSSMTTHPTLMCQEACAAWTGTIVRIMQETGPKGGGNFTKLDIVEYFATFPYTNAKLRGALAFPDDELRTKLSSLTSAKTREAFYRDHHPIMKLIARTERTPSTTKHKLLLKTIPSDSALPSSGYVLHTLVAALYCFLATETFEEGAIMAVNLGNDADTVGAVYAGLAGCWYGTESEEDGKGVFWTERVRQWKEMLVRRDLVEEVGEELVVFSASLTALQ